MAESEAAAAAAAATATIAVKFTSSDKAAGQVSIPLDSTVGALKEAIRSQFDVEPKRIIFQGRILNKDDQTLQDCKLKDGLTVVVQVAAAGASTAAAGTSSATPGVSSASPGAAPSPAAGGGVAAASAGLQGLNLAGGQSAMAQALATVRGQPAGTARECFTTLLKVVDNIVAHPLEEKYRKIKRANAGFRRKVGGVPGGDACMRALGFFESGDAQESWLLTPNANSWVVLNSGRAQIQSALAILPAAGPAAAAAGGGAGAGLPSGGFAGGMGVLPPPGAFPQPGFGGGGMGGGAGGMPDMATLARMAQDPNLMQGMMNDPGVQAMMRSNPQMAAAVQSVMASPGGIAQAFNMMQNNPGMAQMAQQMMQDPAALERATQMGLGSLEGSLAAGMAAGSNAAAQGFQPQPPSAAPSPPLPSPAAVATPQPQPPVAAGVAGTMGGGAEGGQGQGQDQEEKTEDELIAEAIRRSMED